MESILQRYVCMTSKLIQIFALNPKSIEHVCDKDKTIVREIKDCVILV